MQSKWSRRSILAAGVGAGVTTALTPRSARAQSYPTRPIRFVVGYAPGGATDVLARLIAEPLGRRLGQQVLVENRPGAGNNIGTDVVVRAEPDGHTILLANPANGINDSLYKNLSFKFQRDIAPVAGIMRSPNIMEVSPKLPIKTVQEFIDYCKANPDKVNMASSGIGTSLHMSGELFKAMTGAPMVHVPYRGAGPAIIDMIAGHADVIFDNLPSSIGHVRGGTLRALAVTTAERSPALPDVPTVAETVPGYEASAWFGIGAPRKTPPELIARLNKEVNDILADPAMEKKLTDLGGTPLRVSPDAFGLLIGQEIEKWRKVVAFSGATVD
ncbi:Bug family tripartite tricarboxylate transporter substrate binding protein [Methylobacterium sp. PvR107]|uniref:Bug family tripartite tricarboxylate transporter substrate binding protein n=1 Tax=Methylobacterium sp. PvR107 TaxID=2806597 RepID=UPI001AEA0CF2|nr:tripartite tricarboxylate transporter substrate binding protein [Methylobacterium sp. PvR107]MBP1181759.1 tripartite-type tricarboxylate transporter receptor subunit TctC [Methylobacterium sp. PvR107]